LIARVAERRDDASDASAEVVRRQLQSSALLPAEWDLIDANGSVEQTTAEARTALHR
jgi:predicted kinase